MINLYKWIVAAVLVSQTLAPNFAFAQSDTAEAERLFRRCLSCHSIGVDAINKVGPQLNDIIGRTAGSVEGFRYSRNMVTAGAGGLVWDEASLMEFLRRPRDFVPGNKMRFNGIRDVAERQILVAYIAQTSANGGAGGTMGGDPDISPEILAIEGDLAYGQYLASTCVTCHQLGGVESNIPSITGWPAETMVTVLHAYKNQDRDNDVMQQQTGILSNEEIAALAAYFETLN